MSELEQFARGAPMPIVSLTGRPCSRAYPRRRWWPARVAIRRQLAARGPSRALRGEIAHEYAHVLEPDGWQQFALFVLATELWAVGLAMWLIGVIASWIDHAHAPLWLGLWFVGMVLMCASVCCHARISHRRELRADALAAKLLGDSGPVLAMLDDLQAMHGRLGKMARLCGLLTHPSPSRRRRELVSVAVDGTPTQIQLAR